jgi:hypothetical protein
MHMLHDTYLFVEVIVFLELKPIWSGLMHDVLDPWMLLSADVTVFYKEAELISLSWSRRVLENAQLLLTLTCCIYRLTRNKRKVKQKQIP